MPLDQSHCLWGIRRIWLSWVTDHEVAIIFLRDVHVLVDTSNILLQMFTDCGELLSIDTDHGKVTNLLPNRKDGMAYGETKTFPRRLKSNNVRATT